MRQWMQNIKCVVKVINLWISKCAITQNWKSNSINKACDIYKSVMTFKKRRRMKLKVNDLEYNWYCQDNLNNKQIRKCHL